MKARVKATGEIVEVHTCDDADFQDRQGRFYWEHQLYFGTLDDFDKDVPDYWEKLKHQYAGTAMQSYISNNVYLREIRKMCKEPQEMRELVADLSILLATALVEKLKNEGVI